MFSTFIENKNGIVVALFDFKNKIDSLTFFLETDFNLDNDTLTKDGYTVKEVGIDKNSSDLLGEVQATFYSKSNKLDCAISYYKMLILNKEFFDKFKVWRNLSVRDANSFNSKFETLYIMKINYEQFLKANGEKQCHQNF